MARISSITLQYANKSNFKGLGQLIKIPDDESKKPDFESDILTFYGGLGLINSNLPIELGICIFKKREMIIEQFECHSLTQELLYAIDDDFVMPVAPNLTQKDGDVPDLEKAVAIRIRRGEGVIFERGVWHSVPYPFKDESFALVGFTKNTAKNDLKIFNLKEKIRMVE